jgi:hypothetical protein
MSGYGYYNNRFNNGSGSGSNTDTDEETIYDSDTMSVSSVNLNADDLYADEAICRAEKTYHDTDKYDGQYVLGFPVFEKIDREYILSVSVSTKSFFKYDCLYVMEYLIMNSSIKTDNCLMGFNQSTQSGKIDILKINIGRYNEYFVVIKTFWLKIIQRTWKRVFKKKQTQMRILQQTIMEALRNNNRAIISTLKMEINNMASLRGMIKR